MAAINAAAVMMPWELCIGGCCGGGEGRLSYFVTVALDLAALAGLQQVGITYPAAPLARLQQSSRWAIRTEGRL
jgi:hypothetical protein